MTNEPSSNLDLGPLSWVKPECDQALRLTQEALSAFAQQPTDTTYLQHSQSHFHQVAGALQILSLDGIAPYTAEIERQLTRLAEADAGDVQSALPLIQRSIRGLQDYIDDLAGGQAAPPLRLYPDYKAMQQLRGIEVSAPTDLFFPDLSQIPPKSQSMVHLPAERVASYLVRQRRLFQQGLLGWLHAQPGGAEKMRQAIQAIEDAQGTPAQRSFWWCVGGLLESLENSPENLSLAIKRLCARIDLQIRRRIEGSTKVADRLRREVLYCLTLWPSEGSRAQSVRQTYKLSALLPPPGSTSDEQALIQSVVRESHELLSATKEAWLKYTSGRPDSLPALQRSLQLLATAVQRLGTGPLLTLLDALANTLQALPASGSGKSINESLALEYATGLLLAEGALNSYSRPSAEFPAQVEAMVERLDFATRELPVSPEAAGVDLLDSITRQAQERLLFTQVVGEIQVNLRHIEQVLDGFFRDRSKYAELIGLGSYIKQIQGALRMLGLDKASELLTHCEAQIERFAKPELEATGVELELLAESLSGLGFYLDAVTHQRSDSDLLIEHLLRKQLGIAEEPARRVEDTVETGLIDQREQLNPLLDALHQQPEDEHLRAELKQQLESVKQDADLVADSELSANTAAALSLLEESSPAASAALTQTLQAIAAPARPSPGAPVPSAEAMRLLSVSADKLDAELLEIYLTEADEVLDGVAQKVLQARAEPHNTDALKTIRRGFHTLKGSGRMVGLDAFGELAWGVEQRLNRWIEEEHLGDPVILRMIDVAQTSFRDWVHQLKSTGRVEADAGPLESELLSVDEALDGPGLPPPGPPPPGGSGPTPGVPDGNTQGAAGEPTYSVPDIQPHSEPAPTEVSAGPSWTDVATEPTPEIQIGSVTLTKVLYGILVEEAQQHVATLRNELENLAAEPSPHPSDSMVRAAHTLCGIHRTAGFAVIAETAYALEQCLLTIQQSEARATISAMPAVTDAIQIISRLVRRVMDQQGFSTDDQAAAREVDLRLRAIVKAEMERHDKSSNRLPALAEEEIGLPGILVPPSTHEENGTLFHICPAAPAEIAQNTVGFIARDSPTQSRMGQDESDSEQQLASPIENSQSAAGGGSDFFSPIFPEGHAHPGGAGPPEPREVATTHTERNTSHSLADNLAASEFYQPSPWQDQGYLEQETGIVLDVPERNEASQELVLNGSSRSSGTFQSGFYPTYLVTSITATPPGESGRELRSSASALQLSEITDEMLLWPPHKEFLAIGGVGYMSPEKHQLLGSDVEVLDRPFGATPQRDLQRSIEAESLRAPIFPSGDLMLRGDSATRAANSELDSPPIDWGTASARHDESPNHRPTWTPSGKVQDDVEAGFVAEDEPLSFHSGSIAVAPLLEEELWGSDENSEGLVPSADPILSHSFSEGSKEIDVPESQLGGSIAWEKKASNAPADPMIYAPGPVYASANSTDYDPLANVADDLDEQLLPIFLEEAQELFPQAAEQLRQWRKTPASPEPPKALHRTLHTFKGSARMAGAMRLGELVHLMESRLLSEPQAHPDAHVFDFLELDLDRAALALDALQRGKVVPLPPALDSSVPPSPEVNSLVTSDPANLAEAHSAASAAPTAVDTTAPFGVAAHSASDLVSVESAPRPMLRVRADVVDRLVNEVGEISISRTRVEGELRELKGNLLELTNSVIRLRQQVREIEIQADSQIQSSLSYKQEAEDAYDPLEFDRYTRFQELSRSLTESVNDVSTVQQALLKNLHDADTALLIQARLNRDVQQDLLAVRTVPFGSLSERLYRLMRQTAKELGKKSNLEIRGAQVELDRSVLEKLVGPLEHLLRNAIDHGIEPVENRLAAGKSDVGEITMDARQVSNEIVITIADDGGGMDFGRIRERAEELGLLPKDSDAGQAQLLELIFAPGFSTAAQVTQISGRGVGMDVVRSELAGLGGRVEAKTSAGKGSTFMLYLPLTLAVAQTVLVRAGGKLYAIPTPLIEQVQHLKAEELINLYVTREAIWKGRTYPMFYLPHLLGDNQHHADALRYNSLLLLRSGTQPVAIHVDHLYGNQEVVVKNIGLQLARVPGITGATVLGSGEVVLIINPVQLVQRMGSLSWQPSLPPRAVPSAEDKKAGLVMVVDDSLTVRKITGRLLTREGYEVVTAKDGVDALQALNDSLPDIILLDIEMPRMDGFEFARTIRNDQRTKHIPIIIITSRTAEKHRNQAKQLGIELYLGKPYQEDELLTQIRSVLA